MADAVFESAGFNALNNPVPFIQTGSSFGPAAANFRSVQDFPESRCQFPPQAWGISQKRHVYLNLFVRRIRKSFDLLDALGSLAERAFPEAREGVGESR